MNLNFTREQLYPNMCRWTDGTKVRLCGKIVAYQDFNHWEFDFGKKGEVFTVDAKGLFNSENGVWLIAKGYGLLSEPESYGNGAIYLSWSQIQTLKNNGS